MDKGEQKREKPSPHEEKDAGKTCQEVFPEVP